MSPRNPGSNLGARLVEKGLITKEALAKAQKASKRGTPLQKTLVEQGSITEEKLIDFMAKELNIPCVKMSDYVIDPKIVKIVPEKLARHYTVIPLFKVLDTLTIAMADPSNFYAIEDIKIKTKCELNKVLASEKDINKAIDKYYAAGVEIMEEAIKDLKEISLEQEAKEEASPSQLQHDAEDAPIVKLVNSFIAQAINRRASDIHLEPYEKDLRIRYRIDGVLYEVASPPKNLQGALVSRLKILSQLDIAERRLPQDGRFRMRIKDKSIDLRLSTLPTIFGEKVVMRILDKGSLALDMKDLGMEENMLAGFEKAIASPYGMVVVTGPTGSGKTTTLYSALNKVNSVGKNIITVEDPVEYRIHGINQVQVQPKIGLTFAAGLRSILRQDPDIVMVGEVRDLETAEIAIRAALTGHLVFTTLHTNDAVGTLARLVDMGIEPFLVASSVVVVMAQRLVRRICPDCKKEYTPPQEMQKIIKEKFPDKDIKFYKGVGCKNCNNTGYRGRVGVHEVLSITDEIKEMIINRKTPDEIEKAARKQGFISLSECGLLKVANGITSLEEVHSSFFEV
ncbi:MAG: type IV-A pilus assembly ATPase PilB [Candidatus Omnitrophica bacterium]|nr:type IV-A pilus assembly ATPase PilB [Candidatus Omnitrophota bacterium]